MLEVKETKNHTIKSLIRLPVGGGGRSGRKLAAAAPAVAAAVGRRTGTGRAWAWACGGTGRAMGAGRAESPPVWGNRLVQRLVGRVGIIL